MFSDQAPVSSARLKGESYARQPRLRWHKTGIPSCVSLIGGKLLPGLWSFELVHWPHVGGMCLLLDSPAAADIRRRRLANRDRSPRRRLTDFSTQSCVTRPCCAMRAYARSDRGDACADGSSWASLQRVRHHRCTQSPAPASSSSAVSDELHRPCHPKRGSW